ncbi:hypothetical protein BGP84_06745 [Pseudomonas putida]|uniref:Uncharacterized protein n=1 Tax=Pseudomonas putida TaxID=303 RepID=A0A2S3X1I1_PSEPU|nr:hypothetical protein [Pseudomonas putida]POG09441.1 hypothetical protein BGP84_06745 [Pseudomonas putida]POG15585.1 hypothetical protein BGP85_05230 [Pseudomonas putida]
MPFIVINRTNALDPIRTVEYATEAEADAAARNLLSSQPGSEVLTAKLLKRYSAKVEVTEQEAADIAPEAPAEEAGQ